MEEEEEEVMVVVVDATSIVAEGWAVILASALAIICANGDLESFNEAATVAEADIIPFQKNNSTKNIKILKNY